MLNMAELATSMTQTRLFQNLANGSHGLFLLAKAYPDEGIIIFIRPDCKPTLIFQIGVAGNLLLVSEFYRAEVENWLTRWGYSFKAAKIKFNSAEEAWASLKAKRELVAKTP